MKIAFFVTCLTDNFQPRAGIAAVKVLEHLGCQVAFPAAQTCCGQPMFNNGLHAAARDLARRMIEVFEPHATVVTPSASCAAMVRKRFPQLLEGDADWAPRAAALAGRTFEFVEFLVKVLKVDLGRHQARWPGQVTWHASCHQRDLGLERQTETLLGQIAEVRYVPLAGVEQCCGFGGTFALHYSAISGAMVADKAAAIHASGAPTVVSNDAGCSMNLAGACHRRGQSVRFKHLAEVIAEGLGLMEGL